MSQRDFIDDIESYLESISGDERFPLSSDETRLTRADDYVTLTLSPADYNDLAVLYIDFTGDLAEMGYHFRDEKFSALAEDLESAKSVANIGLDHILREIKYEGKEEYLHSLLEDEVSD